jgi:hypothetical protein
LYEKWQFGLAESCTNNFQASEVDPFAFAAVPRSKGSGTSATAKSRIKTREQSKCSGKSITEEESF